MRYFSREHLGSCGGHYTNSRVDLKELAVLQGNIEDEIAQELAGMEMEGKSFLISSIYMGIDT